MVRKPLISGAKYNDRKFYSSLSKSFVLLGSIKFGNLYFKSCENYFITNSLFNFGLLSLTASITLGPFYT